MIQDPVPGAQVMGCAGATWDLILSLLSWVVLGKQLDKEDLGCEVWLGVAGRTWEALVVEAWRTWVKVDYGNDVVVEKACDG